MAIKNILETIRDTMAEEMRRDPRIVITGEDVGPRGGVFRATQGLFAEFGPDRVIDSPLSESSIIAVGIGLALHGLRPICEIQFADFIFPAMNQIVSEAGLMRYRSNGTWTCPLVIRAPYGGGIGGGLYHSQSIEATFAHFPGLYVVAPATPYDAKGLLRAALQANDPVLFLENKKTYRLVKGEVPDGQYVVPIGRADVKRRGRDLSVFTYGMMLHECLKAAEELAGGRRRGRGGGPAHDLAAGQGDDPRIGGSHQQGARRPRGQPILRRGRGGGRHHRGRGLRRPGRAGAALRRPGRTRRALQPADAELFHAGRQADCGIHALAGGVLA